jgi:hypothetical protein
MFITHPPPSALSQSTSKTIDLPSHFYLVIYRAVAYIPLTVLAVPAAVLTVSIDNLSGVFACLVIFS